jgi:hypothetical protein
MRRLRRVTFAKLRRFAVDLGIAGGIVAHQISPDRTTSWRRGIPSGLASFRHDYTMLGEVSFRSESELKALRERIDFDSYPHAVIYVNNPNLAPAYSQIRLFWSFVTVHPNSSELAQLRKGSVPTMSAWKRRFARDVLSVTHA